MSQLPKLFVTGTMRTGGSLLINLLSAHPKLLILNERVHFFRFVYGRYNPLNPENLDYMLNDQRLRLKYRKGIDLKVDMLRDKITKLGITYKNIYAVLMDYFREESGKDIWGEFAGLQWREVPIFLDFFEEGKVIHTFRDPRGVFASWKKLSSIKNNAYLNCLFNWVDSTNYIQKYKRILSSEKYYANKYENIMNDPKTYVTKLINFIGIEVDEILFQPERWSDTFNPKLVTVPRSAHDGDGILGYSTKRVDNWKKNLEDWEICLADYICGKNMDILGYERVHNNIDENNSLLQKGIEEMKKNNFVYSNFKKFMDTGEGINKYPMDPTDPRSWGQKSNPSHWFIESEEGKEYYQELAISSKAILEKYL